MKPLDRLFAIALAVAWTTNAAALDPSQTVAVTPLLKTTTSWNGQPLTWPTTGPAELTGLIVEIAPGGETGWHRHPVPSFGVITQGELEVDLKDGSTHRFHAGDPIAEVVDTWHNGRNVGSEPLKILVFYAGTVGQPLTVRETGH